MQDAHEHGCPWDERTCAGAAAGAGPALVHFVATLKRLAPKMVVTQLVYRPANVFLFLVAQSFFRGDSARQLVHVLRTKFKVGLTWPDWT